MVGFGLDVFNFDKTRVKRVYSATCKSNQQLILSIQSFGCALMEILKSDWLKSNVTFYLTFFCSNKLRPLLHCICEILCMSTRWIRFLISTVLELNRAGIRTWGRWVRSANATFVLCSPQTELVEFGHSIAPLCKKWRRSGRMRPFTCSGIVELPPLSPLTREG